MYDVKLFFPSFTVGKVLPIFGRSDIGHNLDWGSEGEERAGEEEQGRESGAKHRDVKAGGCDL